MVVFDFDKTLMNGHWYHKYKNTELINIPNNPFTEGPADNIGFALDNKIINLLNKLIGEKIQIGIASFGQKEVISKVLGSISDEEAVRKSYNSTNVALPEGVTKFLNTGKTIQINDNIGKKYDCFDNIYIITPGDFDGFTDGTGDMHNKNQHLDKLKELYNKYHSEKIDKDNILFFDDDRKGKMSTIGREIGNFDAARKDGYEYSFKVDPQKAFSEENVDQIIAYIQPDVAQKIQTLSLHTTT